MNKDSKPTFADSRKSETTTDPKKPAAVPEKTSVEQALDDILQLQLNDKQKPGSAVPEDKAAAAKGPNAPYNLRATPPARSDAVADDVKELMEMMGSPLPSKVKETPPPAAKEAPPTTSEKERMLKTMRDEAAKIIEDNKASRARLEQSTVASKPADDKKPAVAPDAPKASAPAAKDPFVAKSVDEKKPEAAAAKTTLAFDPFAEFDVPAAAAKGAAPVAAAKDAAPAAAAKGVAPPAVAAKDAAPVAAAKDAAPVAAAKDAAPVAAASIVKDPAPVASLMKDAPAVVTASAAPAAVVAPPAKEAAPAPAAVVAPPVKEAAPAPAAVVAPAPVRDTASALAAAVASAKEFEPAPVMAPRKESFVTAAEKERMLRSIRDTAAKEIEDKKAMRARLDQVAVEAGGAEAREVVISGSNKAEVVAVETTITSQDVASEAPPTVLDEVAHPGTLVPPPLRPSVGSLRHKPEMRSATQTRINEAYLRQLKGEEPLPDDLPPPKQPLPAAPRRASSRRPPNSDGTRVVAVESLGVGIFNALGDMVGGVVQIGRSIGSGAKKVVAVDPVTSTSGTARMADKMTRGVRGVFAGTGEIVKGSGNIVVGAIGVVTLPVVEAVGAVITSIATSGKAAAKPGKAAAESAAPSQNSSSDS